MPAVGTRIGLIVTYLTFSLPFSIWMLPPERSSTSATKWSTAMPYGCAGGVT